MSRNNHSYEYLIQCINIHTYEEIFPINLQQWTQKKSITA